MTNFHYVRWLPGDFNARCSRWWKNNITNLKGQELDCLALAAAYNQIIDINNRNKPTHVINNSMSCIDVIFCISQSVISNHGSMFQFLINVITILFTVKLTYVYLFLQYISERSGIIKK